MTTTQWEYKTLKMRPLTRKAYDADEMNTLGADGWELVNVTHDGIGIFKRPVRS